MAVLDHYICAKNQAKGYRGEEYETVNNTRQSTKRDADRKRAFDAGMNGHIVKPIDIEKLGAVILSVLKKQENLQTRKNNSMSR